MSRGEGNTRKALERRRVMQRRSSITGRAALIGCPGEGHRGGYLLIKTGLENLTEWVTMGKKTRGLYVCVAEQGSRRALKRNNNHFLLYLAV